MAATALAARRRMTPQESRDAALEAARALLLESGPQAVTLKAVAARIGRTHANLLHHFGSAAGLQKALIERMARSEEHTSELQSLMRISYAVFCLKKKKKHKKRRKDHILINKPIHHKKQPKESTYQIPNHVNNKTKVRKTIK